jgi:hypothetical protein
VDPATWRRPVRPRDGGARHQRRRPSGGAPPGDTASSHSSLRHQTRQPHRERIDGTDMPGRRNRRSRLRLSGVPRTGDGQAAAAERLRSGTGRWLVGLCRPAQESAGSHSAGCTPQGTTARRAGRAVQYAGERRDRWGQSVRRGRNGRHPRGCLENCRSERLFDGASTDTTSRPATTPGADVYDVDGAAKQAWSCATVQRPREPVVRLVRRIVGTLRHV